MADPQTTPEWSGPVAFKKMAWGLAKLLTAKAMAIPALGPAINTFNSLGLFTQSYGLTFHADPVLMSKGLPLLLFAGLISIHDALKLKTGISWL